MFFFQKYITLWIFNGEEGYQSLCPLGFGSCAYVHAYKLFEKLLILTLSMFYFQQVVTTKADQVQYRLIDICLLADETLLTKYMK